MGRARTENVDEGTGQATLSVIYNLVLRQARLLLGSELGIGNRDKDGVTAWREGL